ncbi:hypothetical protein V5O48_011332 [Marasmius crinis-equi]|uniref:Uncharacterized protein n=1 Tax=Marasmius crinis-equi TaxID=585013 RepID=A0ABR3F611_9AGAR
MSLNLAGAPYKGTLGDGVPCPDCHGRTPKPSRAGIIKLKICQGKADADPALNNSGRPYYVCTNNPYIDTKRAEALGPEKVQELKQCGVWTWVDQYESDAPTPSSASIMCAKGECKSNGSKSCTFKACLEHCVRYYQNETRKCSESRHKSRWFEEQSASTPQRPQVSTGLRSIGPYFAEQIGLPPGYMNRSMPPQPSRTVGQRREGQHNTITLDWYQLGSSDPLTFLKVPFTASSFHPKGCTGLTAHRGGSPADHYCIPMPDRGKWVSAEGSLSGVLHGTTLVMGDFALLGTRLPSSLIKVSSPSKRSASIRPSDAERPTQRIKLESTPLFVLSSGSEAESGPVTPKKGKGKAKAAGSNTSSEPIVITDSESEHDSFITPPKARGRGVAVGCSRTIDLSDDEDELATLPPPTPSPTSSTPSSVRHGSLKSLTDSPTRRSPACPHLSKEFTEDMDFLFRTFDQYAASGFTWQDAFKKVFECNCISYPRTRFSNAYNRWTEASREESQNNEALTSSIKAGKSEPGRWRPLLNKLIAASSK